MFVVWFLSVFGCDWWDFMYCFEYIENINCGVFFNVLEFLDVVEVELNLWYWVLIFSFFDNCILFKCEFVVVGKVVELFFCKLDFVGCRDIVYLVFLKNIVELVDLIVEYGGFDFVVFV